MLTLIGAFLGLLGSLLPEILKFFNNKEDHKHEIEMGKLQMESSKLEHIAKLAEIEVQADIAESQAIYQFAEPKVTGWKWVDALASLYQSSVRPTITYAFMVFYGLVKFAQYHIVSQSNQSTWTTIWQLWNSEDMALFSTIMGFWFGGRLLKKAWERYGTPERIGISAPEDPGARGYTGGK